MSTLAEIKDEIKADSVIDPQKLDHESIKIANLHSKWIGKLAYETLILRDIQKKHDKVLLSRTLYFSGKATDEEYKAEPLNLKILKGDLSLHLNADDAMNEAKDKLHEQTVKVNMIEVFMKELSQRSFNIKNNIEYQKFKAGA